jgi:hypothetical protein
LLLLLLRKEEILEGEMTMVTTEVEADPNPNRSLSLIQILILILILHWFLDLNHRKIRV